MGVGTAIGVSAGIGAIGSGVAASKQAGAAKNAAGLQYRLGEDSLAFQKQQWLQNQQNLAPWIKAGGGAVGQLSDWLGQAGAGQGPFAPWTGTFQAPTDVTEQNDPGYKFRLAQGKGALQNSAAAAGGLLTGNTGEALQQFGQDYASNEYQNVYNRALNQYSLGYNQFEQNQSNLFNRYASLAGLGQTSAGQLGSLGQQAANNVTNINSTIGGQVGNSLLAGGAATASGYAGAANAIGGGINSLSQYALLQQLLNGGGNYGLPAGAPGGNPADWPWMG